MNIHTERAILELIDDYGEITANELVNESRSQHKNGGPLTVTTHLCGRDARAVMDVGQARYRLDCMVKEGTLYKAPLGRGKATFYGRAA